VAFDNAVLVVIDMQNGFVNERSQPVVPVVAELVDLWARSGRPMLFTRYLNYPGSPFERLIHWTRLSSPPETDIVPALSKAASQSTVIDKNGYTLFSEEGRSVVERAGWTDLVFCGIATESCVLKSAVDAFEAGLTPWVLSDASASHAGGKVHEAGLLVIGRFIGPNQIITVADLTERTALSAHPVEA